MVIVEMGDIDDVDGWRGGLFYAAEGKPFILKWRSNKIDTFVVWVQRYWVASSPISPVAFGLGCPEVCEGFCEGVDLVFDSGFGIL